MKAFCSIFEKERNELIIKIKNWDFTLPMILCSTEYVVLNATIVHNRKIVKRLENMQIEVKIICKSNVFYFTKINAMYKQRLTYSRTPL